MTALPFPPEIRVVKEGVTLADAGYQSGVMCPPIAGRPARETWRGIEIFRPESLARASSAVDKLLFYGAYVSPAWLAALREVIAAWKPDVLHVHDIWLGRAALMARTHQKIVLDLHENMPAAVVEHLKALRGAQKLIFGVTRPFWRTLRYERALLRRSDLVLGVVAEARTRVLDAHPGLDPAKVVNVENLESKSFVAGGRADVRVIEPDHFSILYIGGFGPHRGIDTLIRAMRQIKAWGLNVKLHLVGAQKGTTYAQMIDELIREMDVASHVIVTGWVPPDLVPTYIKQASVCAVPHHANAHTDNTIPHKLFQYMIAGRPVFVSSSAPLERTVRAAQAGVVFRAGDVADCAARIREMAANPAALQQAGARGLAYVMDQGHNWEDESAPALIAAYDRMLGCAPSNGTKGSTL